MGSSTCTTRDAWWLIGRQGGSMVMRKTHRALIIKRESTAGWRGGGRLELQLPASSFLNEILFSAINKCRLFIYDK